MVVNDYILRLDIPMTDSFIMHVFYSFCQLPIVIFSGIFTQAFLCSFAPHNLINTLSCYVFLNQDYFFLGFKGAIKLREVGTV